jgi:hypothetical protein
MSLVPSFFLDNKSYLSLNTIYILTLDNDSFDLRYILALLNSKLLFWIFKQLGSTLGERGLRYFKQFVELLPIYPTDLKEQYPFIEKADKMIYLNNDLNDEINGFKEWLKRDPYHIDKFSQKLDKYYELSFDKFLAELNKKKIDTKQRKVQELLKNEFEESVNKINPLLLQINETDTAIDQIVYDLYGLTPEEIKIIEDSLDG